MTASNSKINVTSTGDISCIGKEPIKTNTLEYLSRSLSEASKKALKSDLGRYMKWAESNGDISLPSTPVTIANYLSHMATSGKRYSTIARHKASLSKYHQLMGLENPCNHELVRTTLQGIRRTHGVTVSKAKALTGKYFLRVLTAIDSFFWIDRRNYTLIAIGWLGALRISEIVSLDTSDIEEETTGILVHLKRSKTDQEGEGATLALPHCPVTKKITSWVEALAAIYSGANGPLFPVVGLRDKWIPRVGERKRLTVRAASKAVKRSFEIAGIDTSKYSAHSLRSGFITTSAQMGVPEHIIQRHSRHASLSVLREYIQTGRIWEDNPLPIVLSRLFGSHASASQDR